MMPTFADYKPEIDAYRKAGYRIVERVVLDYGHTLGLSLRRGKRFYRVMLRECFYDTDSKGNRTKWHGVLDIRDTPWSRELRS